MRRSSMQRLFVAVVLFLGTGVSTCWAMRTSAWWVYTIPNENVLTDYARNFQHLAVFGYHFDAQDNLVPATPWVNEALARQRANPTPGRVLLLTFVNDGPSGQKDPVVAHRVLSHPTSRTRHIAQIVAASDLADGVEIDYESMQAETRPYFTQFIQELRAALPTGKKLSVAIQPQADSLPGSGGRVIDWVAIEPYVDYLKLMAYYFSYGATPPGPVVSLEQAFITAHYALFDRRIPPEKFHMAFCLWGYDWPQYAGGRGRAVQYAAAMQLAQRPGAVLDRLPDDTLRIRYTDTGGQARIIYIDDKKSLVRKIEAVQRLGVRHFDLWQLGTGDPAFWAWYRDHSTPPTSVGPEIVTLTPSAALARGPSFTLTATGKNFAQDSVLQWQGSNRPTQWISSTELRASIPASDIAAPANAALRVFTPGNPSALSVEQIFPVTAAHPIPGLVSFSPSWGMVGGGSFTLTVRGMNFLPGALLYWNGQPRETQVLDSGRLTAVIQSSDRSTASYVPITVVNPQSGNAPSNSLYFRVGTLAPIPELITLEPDWAQAGSSSASVIIHGNNFLADTQVLWNGVARTATRLDATRFELTLSDSDLSVSNVIPVTVRTPSAGDMASDALNFLISPGNSPIPRLTRLSPASGIQQGGAFTLTVEGTGFATGAQVFWNDQPRPTQRLSSTRLQAAILATDRPSAEDARVTVLNPRPGGGLSQPLVFAIGGVDAAGPLITRLSPTQGIPAGGAFTLTVQGTGFQPGATVFWRGLPKPTSYIDATRLTIPVYPFDRPVVEQVPVTVINVGSYAPSNAMNFNVTLPAPLAAPTHLAQAFLAPSHAAPRVYPNPWRADRHGGPVSFDGLGDATELKIFTVSAHWVRTIPVMAGAAQWDRTNSAGENVASGIYLYLVRQSDGSLSRGKFAIIR